MVREVSISYFTLEIQHLSVMQSHMNSIAKITHNKRIQRIGVSNAFFVYGFAIIHKKHVTHANR